MPVAQPSSTPLAFAYCCHLCRDIGAAVAQSAVGYKPKFNVPHDPHGAVLKLQHMPKLPAKELPKDLHDKLETIGAATLKVCVERGSGTVAHLPIISLTPTRIAKHAHA